MAEHFDAYAADYDDLLRRSLGAVGGDLDYFRRRKAALALELTAGRPPRRILEYGCGTGGNLAHLARTFPGASLCGCDISEKSLEEAAANAPGATLCLIGRETLPQAAFDLVFVANVLHHVPPPARPAVVAAMAGTLAPGGMLCVFEHNPANPVTRRVVARCPFDAGVTLLPPDETAGLARRAGLPRIRRRYISFFPPAFGALAPLEALFGWLPLGGQYVIAAGREDAVSAPRSGRREGV